MLMQVTTLLSKADEMAAEAKAPPADLDSLKAAASQQGATVKQAKEASPCLHKAKTLAIIAIPLKLARTVAAG